MGSLQPKDVELILDINRKINSLTDVKSILLDISHHAAELIEAEGASILLVDRDSGTLHFEVAFSEKAEALYEVVIPKGKGIAGTVAQNGEVIIVNNTANDERFYKGVDNKTNLTTRNLIAVPLIRNDEIIGVMEVINKLADDGFHQDHATLLLQFAQQAAIAISNALLYRDIQDKANELEYLFEISTLTNTTFEKKVLFQKIVELIAGAFGSRRVSIMFVDEKTGKLTVESAVGIPGDIIESIQNDLDDERISSVVVSSGKAIYGNDIARTNFGRNKKLRYNKPNFISIPIKCKNIPVGVVNISEPNDGVFYTASMIKTLQTITNQVGTAYESNKSYVERIEHEKIHRELEIMRMLQQALLTTNFKHYNNVSIYAKMIAAEIVGGDFYDIFELSPTRLGFVIGDVSGKGLPASLFMAISRSVVKAYSYYTEKPHILMQYANSILVEDSRVGMFATIFYGVLDIEKRTVQYCNAGHNMQYVYRANQDEFVPLASKGIPIGVTKEQSYETNEVSLEPHDVLFTVTDGVVEAVNDKGEEFGMDRLFDVVRKYASTNSTTIVNSIVREVETWANGVPQWDDITLIVLRMS